MRTQTGSYKNVFSTYFCRLGPFMRAPKVLWEMKGSVSLSSILSPRAASAGCSGGREENNGSTQTWDNPASFMQPSEKDHFIPSNPEIKCALMVCLVFLTDRSLCSCHGIFHFYFSAVHWGHKVAIHWVFWGGSLAGFGAKEVVGGRNVCLQEPEG